MADVHLRQEDLKALDQARQKLFQLAGHLGGVKNDLLQNNPLPEWESLQTSASILSDQINDMTKILAQHADLFQKVTVHPSSNFPGRTQEGLLPQLLRKKLDIPVEDWVNEGRTTQATNEAEKEKENDELWEWAKEYIGERVALYVFDVNGANYTREEREMGIENVRTGLRRILPEKEQGEEESDDEDDKDEEMEDVGLENTSVTATKDGQVVFGMEEVKPGQKNPGGQARRLSDIMRYVTTGDSIRHYPSDRELEKAANKSMEFSPQRGFQNARRP